MTDRRTIERDATRPRITTGPTAGSVCVATTVGVGPQQAWLALVDPDRVAQWFGLLSGPLSPGSSVRLDFEDGDFFDLEVTAVEPPGRLDYSWRFLGVGPQCSVAWRLDGNGKTRLIVTDTEQHRSPPESLELGSGWADFLQRYAGYLRTSSPTRYPWREDIDGATELPSKAALFDDDVQAAWLPLHGSPLEPGAPFGPPLPGRPGPLEVAQVMRRSASALEFTVAASPRTGMSTCSVELDERSGRPRLAFRQIGWADLVTADEDRRRLRTELTKTWIDTLVRARALA